MLFYLAIPIIALIKILIAVLTEAFAKALIITLVTAAPIIASNITITLIIVPITLVVLAYRLTAISISNNGRGSIKKRRKSARIIYSSTKNKGSHGGIFTLYIVGVFLPIGPFSALLDWPIFVLLLNAK